MDFLRCVVERITYENEDNGYSVIKVKAKGFSDLVTVLGSGLIKGIGAVYAKKIVEKFGVETLQIIEETPDDLINVNGIGSKRVVMIKKAWVEQKEIKNVMLFLTEHGVSTAYAVRIYKTYQDKSIETVKNNPYKLADDIWGIGFKTADKIAEKLGFGKDCYVRCRGGILFTLNELSNDGHCYATSEQLISTASELLDITQDLLTAVLEEIIKEEAVIKDMPDKIYIPPLYYSERGVASRLYAIQTAVSLKINADITQDADCLLDKVEGLAYQKLSVRYSEMQKDAIKQALLSKVLVVTGGPGTGKTTTILGIISLLKMLGLEILLAAPTGRAAKRMTETCGFESKTIHRLLGYKPPNGYEHDSDNPLSGDVLIIDECSMIDIVLMNSLLKSVPNEMKIIFVGDIDQLPSVGAGNVLSDIIHSNTVPVIRLNSIFRQAQGSDIIKNAHLINTGQFPSLNNGKKSDFFFIEQEDSSQIPQMIIDLCKERLPKHYGVNPITDIQVLCPMSRSENGAANINTILQAALNPSTVYLTKGCTQYRLGDKVMQIKNNYEKNNFNKSRTRDLYNYPEEIKMPKKAKNLMKQ